MAIKALIIDDERLARAELRNLLKNEDLEIIGEATNGEEAIEKIEELQPDLIFLDIQMPGKTGFEVLENIDKAPNVIFTTAYDEFAIKAFQVNALDYLLKPIDPTRLSESLQKAKKQILNKENTAEGEHLLTPQDQFFVKDGERCWFIKLDQVRIFESAGNYTKVYFDDNKPLVLKSLNALEERLDPQYFFRCSRKQIINLAWIGKIDPFFNNTLLVYLKTGEEIELSRRQSLRFKELMSL